MNSGTDALALALRARGIGPGDEVITAANTCVATITGIVGAGATPVLADVDPVTWTLDPASVERAVTPRTRAVMPVHLYGQVAALDYGLPLVEDAAQARRRASPGAARWLRTASTRRRTWARSATAARSSPTMRRWPSGCGCCARTASAPRRAASASFRA